MLEGWNNSKKNKIRIEVQTSIKENRALLLTPFPKRGELVMGGKQPHTPVKNFHKKSGATPGGRF